MLLDPLLFTALGVGLLSAGLCAYIGNFVLMKNMDGQWEEIIQGKSIRTRMQSFPGMEEKPGSS